MTAEADSNGASTVPVYGTAVPDHRLREAFRSGEVPVAVYGLGKMGLPLAAVYAEVTGNVRGVDIDPAVVDTINHGESPVVSEPGLDEVVHDTVAAGALRATTDAETAAARCRIHVVVVPTLVDSDGQANLSNVTSVLRDVATGLTAGDLVILESTVPPGTCTDRVRPLLSEESGVSASEFGVAFCPERTKSGRALWDIREAHPKVVGGIDGRSSRAAELVYGEITENDVVRTTDATTAECVKLFEGIYRDVNIALANELATHVEELDVDVTEAIDAANTQPFCDLHDPGAGVGGHCIPYYPRFLTGECETDAPLVETARSVNDAMPEYTATAVLDGLRASDRCPGGARVLILGLTYAPGIDEIRETPALPIIEQLVEDGVTAVATDPVTDRTQPFEEAGAKVSDLRAAVGSSYDAVVLVTAHDAFETVDIPALAGDDRLVVVDGRQALTSLRDRPDINYLGVGVNV
jgi:UDP-N-acetyl-D-mannosaminuronic acid dehydrogenase